MGWFDEAYMTFYLSWNYITSFSDCRQIVENEDYIHIFLYNKKPLMFANDESTN